MKVADYETNTILGLKCQTLNLHEDLGLIEYIFSDKTGTLTQNELVFRSISIVHNKETFSIDCLQDGKISTFDLGSKLQNYDPEMFFRCLNICQSCVTIQDEKNLKAQSTFSG